MCRSEPAPTHSTGWRQQRSLDEDRVDVLEAGTGRPLRDRKPVASRTLVAAGDPRELAAGGAGDLLGVGAPVARHERQDLAAVAVEDQRLDDLAELAADRLGARPSRSAFLRELLDAHLGASLAQKGGDPLDGFRARRCVATAAE